MSDKPESAAGVSSPRPAGSVRRRRPNAWAFIAGVERGQRIRLQRDMWKLCTENRALGGTYWRTVLKRFDLKESDVWPNTALTGGEAVPSDGVVVPGGGK